MIFYLISILLLINVDLLVAQSSFYEIYSGYSLGYNFDKFNLLSQHSIVSFKCSYLCLKRVSCKSISYSRTNNTCKLYKISPIINYHTLTDSRTSIYIKKEQDNIVVNYEPGKLIKRTTNLNLGIQDLTLMNDGRIACGTPFSILFLNITSMAVTKPISFSYTLLKLDTLQNGYLTWSASDHITRAWDPITASEKYTFNGISGWVMSMKSLSNGKIALGSANFHVSIWRPFSNSINLLRSSKIHLRPVVALEELPGNLLASGSHDKTVIIYDQNNLGVKITIILADEVHSLKLLSNGYLASGLKNGQIIIHDPNDGSLERTIIAQITPVSCLELLFNGNLACCSDLNRIKIFNPNTGLLIRSLSGHLLPVNSLLLLNNGTLASGSDDGTVSLWIP